MVPGIKRASLQMDCCRIVHRYGVRYNQTNFKILNGAMKRRQCGAERKLPWAGKITASEIDKYKTV